MDYEYYYDTARSKYYNACSEINSCENKIIELESQRRQLVNDINELKAGKKNNQKALDVMGKLVQKDTNLYDKLSKVTTDTDLASENFKGMVAHSDVSNKDLNDVYSNEAAKTKDVLNNVFETLKTKKNALSTDIDELENKLQNAESSLDDIKNRIGETKSERQEWKRIKKNAAYDMEYYRRKMYEAM